MSNQANSSKETFEALSGLAQEQACSVLAHYLKDGGPVTGNDARESVEEAARNIRAAFAELEGITPLDQDPGNKQPDRGEGQ
ncbi:hypothetical protein [Vreelandella janggokensis]|uniref:hypothetical protein n=1 Tax=Vreelandella janggokensis TaxID=370767 RepID=UPI00285DB1AB|nr:hypothetical protein [Halomonas janggokensis]MDR5887537.1 hypothetical protein [Halomonas janggokensis]